MLQKLSVVKSVNSRIALCTMQVFNFSKVNSIIDVLSHWVLPNVKHLLEENLKNRNRTNFTHHQHLYYLHSYYAGRTSSCLLRQSLVNHPTMVENILKFLASRHRQNVFVRLKGHNQNYISWRGISNMLKSWRRSGWASSASGTHAQVRITASGNILASGNISLKLFMALLETIELLIFWYVVDENHIAQLYEVSIF